MKRFLTTLLTIALIAWPLAFAFAAQDDDVTVTFVEQSERFSIMKVAYVQSGAAGTAAHSLESDALDIIKDSFVYLIYVDKTSTDTPELDIKTTTTPVLTIVDIDDIDDGWYDKSDFGVGQHVPVVDSFEINISDAGADAETVTLMIYFYHDPVAH